MLEMAFSSTEIAQIFALARFLTVVKLISEKHCRAVTIKKAHLASGKNKAPLSHLIKFIVKLIIPRNCVLACADSCGVTVNTI